MIILLVLQAPVTLWIFPKKYFLQARPWESAVTNEKSNSYTSSKLYFTQRRQRANPCALILNIEGATDHSCLINRS